MTEATWRDAWAEIHLDRISENARILSNIAAPAILCVAVKADGYGHGAVQAARAALQGGARWLAVAFVEEGRELREAGITAPILVLSEPPAAAMIDLYRNRLRPTLYTIEGAEAAENAAVEVGVGRVNAHVKVDTGMHRVGAQPDEALALLRAVSQLDRLYLEGICTHLATADERDKSFTDEQVKRFSDLLSRAESEGIRPAMVHAANSAATLRFPGARLSMVRCGIAAYGIAPSLDVPLPAGMSSAMTVRSAVTYVQDVPAGEAISYGQRYRLKRDSRIAVVPLGYADGIPRRLGAVGGQVLIGGRRRPIAGTITMDQFMVDCGDDRSVTAGDEVILIGTQGDEVILANEWGQLTDTIGYEVVCRIGPRLPRRYGPETTIKGVDDGSRLPDYGEPTDADSGRSDDDRPGGEHMHQVRSS